ncbi:Leucine carboxyl methyltransferase 1 [Oopsacas minuta]|uniref:Leucine carboxyl methyltransferase 1 n=1 Tax=Oopsacas minuta TaxID=111878 RepID=A0AAV7J7X9_9METZ|nr:Leucine carboxyl methyltransferase 1 [Oopsacas minuta]
MASVHISSVEDTNDEATSCKKLANDLGYFTDPFLKYFCKECPKRSPEINRGYYARYIGMQECVDKFIGKTIGRSPQIVNLGAGFDTLFWRLASCYDNEDMPVVFEVDLHTVTSRKCLHIKTKKHLISLVEKFGKASIAKGELHSDKYHLISCDIQNTSKMELRLISSGLDKDKPILFLCECLLVYIPCIFVQELVTWVAHNFHTSQFVSYGPVNLSDTFGEVMENNLKRSRCDLLGADLCKSLDTQLDLIKPFQKRGVVTMDNVYRNVQDKERRRIEKIELMDEIEPFYQLLSHYCVTIGVNDTSSIGLSTVL